MHWGRSLVNALYSSCAIINSGATGTFGRVQDAMIPTDEPSNKEVGIPDGYVIIASAQALLPMKQQRK